MAGLYSQGSIQVRSHKDNIFSDPTPMESVIIPYELTDVNVIPQQEVNFDAPNTIIYRVTGIGPMGGSVTLSSDYHTSSSIIDDRGYFELSYTNDITQPGSFVGFTITLSKDDFKSVYELPDFYYPTFNYFVEEGTNNVFLEDIPENIGNGIYQYSFDGGKTWADWIPDVNGRVAVPEGVYSMGSIMTKGYILYPDGSTEPGLIFAGYNIDAPLQPRNTQTEEIANTTTITGISAVGYTVYVNGLTDPVSTGPYGGFQIQTGQIITPGVYQLCTSGIGLIGCIPINL